MTISQDGRAPPKSRPGPKPRGRTVVPLTITVTPAQRAALEALADTEQSSISTIVRRFIAVGLAAGGLFVLSALIEVIIARRTGAGALFRQQRSHNHGRAHPQRYGYRFARGGHQTGACRATAP